MLDGVNPYSEEAKREKNKKERKRKRERERKKSEWKRLEAGLESVERKRIEKGRRIEPENCKKQL